MKVLIPILIVLLVGCGESSPTVEIGNIWIEREIRERINKPEGELTEADLGKVTEIGWSGTDVYAKRTPAFELLVEKFTGLESLHLTSMDLAEVPKGLEKLPKLTKLDLGGNRLSDVEGLENLTQLRQLDLTYNRDLYKDQIDELQKALPKCTIKSNPHWHSAPYGPRRFGGPRFGEE
tara:strand:- start:574 stop:1107 length:534 start_codon:yes stop_codon:yes gene_type:complete